jgi:glycosyltransferase involved in cell wall biosynthesis
VTGAAIVRVVYNHRCVHRPMTGVERYASELLRELREVADVTEVVGPAGVVRGQLHEQFVLPVRSGRSLLVSPGNAGPVAARRHLLVIHDLAPLRVPDSFSPRFRRYFGLALSSHRWAGTTIATVSQASRMDLATFLDRDPDRIPIVPNGVRFPSSGDGSMDPPADHDPDDVFVVHLGTVQPRKRVDVLTAVWPEVFRRTGVRLVLIGDRGAAGVFSSSLGAEPSTGVEWRGRLSDDELVRVMRSSSGLISLSAFEGFGLPVLEALAMGRPVVASDIPPHRELAPGRAITLIDVGRPADDREWVDAMVAAVAGAVEAGSIARAEADADDERRTWSWRRSAEALVDALVGVDDR